jgi:serine/threonine protein kinase
LSLPIQELQEKMDKRLSQVERLDIAPEEIQVGETLGCGGFGTVFRATRLTTGELLAVKEARRDRMSMTTWASLYCEVAKMQSLKHSNVLELVGVHTTEPYRIITRFCPGKSLFDRLHRSPTCSLTHRQLNSITFQVAEEMQFLHEHGVVHRDLKTMNILLDDTT